MVTKVNLIDKLHTDLILLCRLQQLMSAPKKYQFQSKKIEKFQKYFDRCALEAQVRSS